MCIITLQYLIRHFEDKHDYESFYSTPKHVTFITVLNQSATDNVVKLKYIIG